MFNHDLLKQMAELSRGDMPKSAFVPSPQMMEQINQMKGAEQAQVQEAGGSGIEGEAQPQVMDPNNPTTMTVDELAQMVGESNEMIMGTLQQIMQLLQQQAQQAQMAAQGAGGEGGKGKAPKPDINAIAQQVQQLTSMVQQLTGGMAPPMGGTAPAGAPMDPAAAGGMPPPGGAMPPGDPAAMGAMPPDPAAMGGAPPPM